MCKFCCGVFLALVMLVIGGAAGALYMYCRENPEAKNELVDKTKYYWDSVKDIGDQCMESMSDKAAEAGSTAVEVGSRVGRTGSRISDAVKEF